MPSVKNARLRYSIIDECLRNPYRPFPGIDTLRETCEEKLFGSLNGNNISKSTIEKDLREMKEEFDAPIAFHRTEKGYYYTEPGYSMDAIPLTADDAESLRFAVLTLNQYKHLSVFDQFQHAIGKIFDRVYISERIDDEAINELVQFETAPAVPGSNWLNPIFNALKVQREINITYYSFNSAEIKKYVIHPYLLKEYRNRWYVIAYRPDKHQMATFELGRIQFIENSKNSFERKPEFNAVDFFKYAFGITVLEGEPREVIFQIKTSELKYIEDTPLHTSQAILERGKTTSKVKLTVYITTELVMTLLSFGNKILVTEPRELAEQLENEKRQP